MQSVNSQDTQNIQENSSNENSSNAKANMKAKANAKAMTVNNAAFKFLVNAQKQTGNSSSPKPLSLVTKVTPSNNKLRYLEELQNFCSELKEKGLLPSFLSIEQGVQVCVIADRLEIPRLDAINSWHFANNGVVIGGKFLKDLFISRQLLIPIVSSISSITTTTDSNIDDVVRVRVVKPNNQEFVGQASIINNYLDNSKWRLDKQDAALELATIQALRKAFPELMMGIICSAEIPPSHLSEAKSFFIASYKKLVTFYQFAIAIFNKLVAFYQFVIGIFNRIVAVISFLKLALKDAKNANDVKNANNANQAQVQEVEQVKEVQQVQQVQQPKQLKLPRQPRQLKRLNQVQAVQQVVEQVKEVKEVKEVSNDGVKSSAEQKVVNLNKDKNDENDENLFLDLQELEVKACQ